MLNVGASPVYSPLYYGQFTPQQLSITGIRIATNEVLSSDNHWSLIRRSIWLSDSWHPLPVPHPDSWSWWSSWLCPRTVITVSCPMIGTRAGSGITRQLLRPSKHGKTGNLKSYFPIFLSFLGKWRTAGDLSPRSDTRLVLGRLQRPWYSGVCRGQYFVKKGNQGSNYLSRYLFSKVSSILLSLNRWLLCKVFFFNCEMRLKMITFSPRFSTKIMPPECLGSGSRFHRVQRSRGQPGQGRV